MIKEFEGITNESQTPLEKHHENTPAFQKRFVSDVKKLESCFPCNPFEINDLVKINNTEVRYNIDVYDALYSLISTGESKFLDFFYNRLIKGKEAINDPIKKNVITSHNALLIKKEDSSILHDLSSLIKGQGQYVQTIKSFNYLSKHLHSRILKASEGYKRCNIVTDRYFSESLKGNIRNIRGLGTAMTFNGEMTLPRDFMDFLGNIKIKII